MLVIRMQRTGRKGHAMFRVVVQDSQRTPTSGKVVARLGSYDPHGKTVVLDKEKAAFYLEHGAQPSGRMVRLLKSEGVKLPDWVKLPAAKERTVRNADKRRSTRPDEPVAEETPVVAPEPPAEAPEEVPADAEAPAETAAEADENTEETAPEPEISEEKSPEEAPTPEAEAVEPEAAAKTNAEKDEAPAETEKAA
jgi:small subunit ribosomal protein S16